MRILMCGGVKTINILNAVKGRFGAGIVYLKEDMISNIGNFVAKGENFNRAIIFEQGISEDGKIIEHGVIRKNLERFVMTLEENYKNYEVVFVAETDTMARILIEETIRIRDKRIVIKKAPTYTVSFISKLVCDEMHEFEKALIFDESHVQAMVDAENEEENISWSDEVEELQGQLVSSGEELIRNIDVTKVLNEFKYTYNGEDFLIERVIFSDSVANTARV